LTADALVMGFDKVVSAYAQALVRAY
jgi:hypothetical protein